MKLIQANARVPQDSRPVLLKAAALMRADPSFTARLQAFLADDEPGATWRDEMAAMSARIAAVEAQVLRKTPVSPVLKAQTSGDEAVWHLAANGGHAHLGTLPQPLAADAVVPPVDWQARAAAITLSTGTGKGRQLTPAGEALFCDMMDAGARAPEMARTLGMAPQSVHYRMKKRRG
ncbi:hypothetical protein [Xanthobacter variabilis]|uniref:hypothetical protein n=1 Tax=Xanthobacter variabilis TaxID=3119932 RepID=UPI00374F76DF